MLTTRLETTWAKLSPEEQASAKRCAVIILDNLVHYSKRNSNYYRDDVDRLAAELIWFMQSGGTTP